MELQKTKIAVPTKNGGVDDHFGHCEAYSVFTIENNKINKIEMLPSPQGCGCKSNIASVLKEIDVTVMLAGNMGDGAVNRLVANGIEVIRGCSGNTREVAESWLAGQVDDSGAGCTSHEDCHDH